MSRYKELWAEATEESDLSGMLNQEVMFQLERLSDLVEAKIDRARYYDEAPTEGTLTEILSELKEIRRRYS